MGTFDYTYEERQIASSEDKYQKFYIETPMEDLETTIAEEDTEVIAVLCQVVDPAGDAIAEEVVVQLIMFTDDTYTTPDAAMTNVTLSMGAAGAIVQENTADVNLLIKTDEEGKFNLEFTDAGGGAETSFMGFILPNGKFVEGGEILFTA